MKLLTIINQVDIPFAEWSKLKTIDLSLIYWLSKLYKCSTKQIYITGFIKYVTKAIFQLLTSIIPAIFTKLAVKIGEKRYSRCDMNQM